MILASIKNVLGPHLGPLRAGRTPGLLYTVKYYFDILLYLTINKENTAT